ncbi:TetR/AcrR family transcriptional regulator [Brevibacillus ginsengisoli]|uniref:TetR/AcrR family transcriptional regulator n=1 Tax=Brevibacillus ginsengisoli TaxID=363854 RepID=UPI003CEE3EF6
MPKARPELIDAFIMETTNAINTDGVTGVHIDKICEKIGVSKGSFYWYFKNKEELLIRVATHFHQKVSNITFHNLNQLNDPLERIREAIGISLKALVENRIHREIWSLTFLYPELQNFLVKIHRERLDYIYRQFLLAKESGQIKGDIDLWSHSQLLVSFYEGAMFKWVINPSEQSSEEMQRLSDYVIQLFVNQVS